MKKFTLIIEILVVGFSLFAQRLAEPQPRLLKITDAPQYNEQKLQPEHIKHLVILFSKVF